MPTMHPTCVGAEAILAIPAMTNIALKKRCFLYTTQSTYFTIIPFIVDINLLSYIRPQMGMGMGRHMGPRAIRRVLNLAPNPKLGYEQQDTIKFMKGSPIAPPNVAHQTPMPQSWRSLP